MLPQSGMQPHQHPHNLFQLSGSGLGHHPPPMGFGVHSHLNSGLNVKPEYETAKKEPPNPVSSTVDTKAHMEVVKMRTKIKKETRSDDGGNKTASVSSPSVKSEEAGSLGQIGSPGTESSIMTPGVVSCADTFGPSDDPDSNLSADVLDQNQEWAAEEIEEFDMAELSASVSLALGGGNTRRNGRSSEVSQISNVSGRAAFLSSPYDPISPGSSRRSSEASNFQAGGAPLRRTPPR